jgi:hypothetical protein
VTIPIRKAPAHAAGVSPSDRAKDLRRVGGSVNVRMDSLTEGHVLLRPEGAFVVVRPQHESRRNGLRVTIRDLENSTIRSIPYVPDGWVSRLELPSVTTLGIHVGDIVLYPHEAPERSVAAIRHNPGWARTAAPWAPFSDAEVVLHIREDKAQIIRNALRPGMQRRKRLPVGSVVACRSVKAPEPTVWIRTDSDYWVSSNRGVTASDLMINYELDRRTYHVVWVPGVR